MTAMRSIERGCVLAKNQGTPNCLRALNFSLNSIEVNCLFTFFLDKKVTKNQGSAICNALLIFLRNLGEVKNSLPKIIFKCKEFRGQAPFAKFLLKK